MDSPYHYDSWHGLGGVEWRQTSRFYLIRSRDLTHVATFSSRDAVKLTIELLEEL